MKTKIYSIAIIFIFLFASCDEQEILKEVPKDFLTTSNAFTEPAHIELALAEAYKSARLYMGQTDDNGGQMDLYFGTDAGWDARSYLTGSLSNYANFKSDNSLVLRRWTLGYKLVFNTNVIINRIGGIVYKIETEKKERIAEARFFRAWAYRNLAHLFGGVPLVLEETTEVKRDYERATREAVYLQCKSDLEFAIENLYTIDKVKDGQISKAAAYHLLAEINLSLGKYQEAVDAASKVIGDSNLKLMTERFGSVKDKPGDVYWDLFRLGNQNRSSGNKESIWVLQVEYNVPGGWGDPTGNEANRWERILGPQYNRFRAKDGAYAFIGETTYHGGRGQGFFRSSSLFTNIAWKGNWDNDIRNSNYNILRKWWVDNPVSSFYNQYIDFNKPASEWMQYYNISTLESDTNTFLYPYSLKYSMINNHFPTELLNGGPMLNAGSRRHYVDNYAMRLSETYLLRAEAYLGLGNKIKAAEDINVVRLRAQANPVTQAEVDINYILDERIRELYIEEPRRITLARLGLVHERTKKYNYWSKSSIQPFNNLYPIPFSEIERNTLKKLEQNPGYN